MAKPGARRVPSDDFAEVIDGIPYQTHEGEWVEVVPVKAVREFEALANLSHLQTQLEAVQASPDASDEDKAAAGAELLRLMDAHFDEVCAAVSGRLVAWNWTDLKGAPLPAPDADVLKRLSAQELNYLLMLAEGEAPDDRKNGSRSMPTTSSATKPTRTRGR